MIGVHTPSRKTLNHKWDIVYSVFHCHPNFLIFSWTQWERLSDMYLFPLQRWRTGPDYPLWRRHRSIIAMAGEKHQGRREHYGKADFVRAVWNLMICFSKLAVEILSEMSLVIAGLCRNSNLAAAIGKTRFPPASEAETSTCCVTRICVVLVSSCMWWYLCFLSESKIPLL